MSTEMKTGLVLSGGGAVGAYQAGVVKALAECGTQISMVSGASIGAFNGAIIAASPDLSEAAVRLEALWDHLGNNQVLSVNRSVYFLLLKKLFQAMNLCQIPGRAGALLTTLLRHISTINGFDNLMAQPLLSDEPLTALMDHYLDTDALADGLPLGFLVPAWHCRLNNRLPSPVEKSAALRPERRGGARTLRRASFPHQKIQGAPCLYGVLRLLRPGIHLRRLGKHLSCPCQRAYGRRRRPSDHLLLYWYRFRAFSLRKPSSAG